MRSYFLFYLDLYVFATVLKVSPWLEKDLILTYNPNLHNLITILINFEEF